MSKTAGDPEASSRIRDNQRRSRARRKEYVAELQQRLQAYEQRGIAATREMQKVAQAVAQENSRLRSLLARHGVSKDEVDSYLRSFDEPASKSGAAPGTGTAPIVPNSALPDSSSVPVGIPDCGASDQVQGLRTYPKTGMDNMPRAEQTGSANSVQLGIANRHDKEDQGLELLPVGWSTESHAEDPATKDSILCAHRGRTGCCDTNFLPKSNSTSSVPGGAHVASKTDTCPSTADCYCPPVPPVPGSEQLNSAFETPCETAAKILAEMSGHGDTNLARLTLGCTSSGDCNVKNTTLFQIMNDY